MQEDDLKAHYKASSQEQSPADLDSKILAQAKSAIAAEQPKPFLRRGWKPVLATAASVTLVATLAFQLVPLHEDHWRSESQESTPLNKAEEASEAITERQLMSQPQTVSTTEHQADTIASDVLTESLTESEPSMRMTAPQSSQTSAVTEAHHDAEHARKKRLEVAKKQRLTEQQRLINLQAQEREILTDKQLTEELIMIQQLLNDGKKQEAEVAWLNLQKKVTAIPKSGTVSLIWNKVAKSFE